MKNPKAKTKGKKQKPYKITRDKYLDRDQRDKLMATCKAESERDTWGGRKTWVTRYMVIHLSLYSGLRVSEIANLTIKDLHLCNIKDPYVFVKNGKGGRNRDVFIDRELVNHLKDYLDIKKKGWHESTEPEAPLFVGHGGEAISAQALAHTFKQALKKAGLPDHYSIHSARHTFATYLLHTSQNLRYVQQRLGHSSLNMTSLYADVLPEMNGSLANSILEDGSSKYTGKGGQEDEKKIFT
jgi:site-specific recombinase XerD